MKKTIPAINQYVKEIRKEKNITQKEFSKLIFKSLATVKRYDSGDIIPEGVLINTCNILKTSFLFLLYIQNEQNKSLKKLNELDPLFYEDLIFKNKEKLLKYQNFQNNEDGNLKKYGEKLLELYELFYDQYYNHRGAIPFDGTHKEFDYTISEDKKIVISLKKISLINEIKNIEIIASFSLEDAQEFIKEIKNYFNFKNDMYKKKSMSLTIGDLFIK